MAWNKEDRAFKILINKRVTTSDKKYYEEFGDNTLDISFTEIKTQKTPYNNPTQGISDGVVKYYNSFVLTEDITVPNKMCYYAVDASDSTRSLTDDRLRYWISSKDGNLYTAKLYDNNDVEITPTACDWFFDYVTGILTFEGAVPNYAKPYKIKGYRYIGAMGGKIGGGFGQKDLYDQNFFPGHEIDADYHVPVYIAQNDRYELRPIPNLANSSIEIITKIFLTNSPTDTFTVDTTIAKIIFVTVNGIVQTEGEDYTWTGKTIKFSSLLSTSKHVVIHYFKNLTATVVSQGNTTTPAVYYNSFSFDTLTRKLSLTSADSSKNLSVDIMQIFDLKFGNWDTNKVYKIGDYAFYSGALYVCLIANTGLAPDLNSEWQSLIYSSASSTDKTLTGLSSAQVIDVNSNSNSTNLSYTVTGNNGIATITNITGIANGATVRIYPTSSTTLNFTNSADLFTEGGLGAKVVGSKGDWIEFSKRANKYYMSNIGTY